MMVRAFWSVLLGCCLGGTALAGVLIETPFGTDQRQPVHLEEPERNLSIKGSLPEGWEDNSSWASLRVVYHQEEEDGERFTRVRVLEVSQGQAQLAYRRLEPAGPGELYQLTLRLRSPSRSPVQFGIRQHGAPYRFYWERREWVRRSGRRFGTSSGSQRRTSRQGSGSTSLAPASGTWPRYGWKAARPKS
ncbi:MAG: hypothetical protein KatS3mg115_1983 [Candidatus Poribacteria bacterium]|nr:MAG: hypothetical protein KatS3mg115_1983 [Candidatus Poribacteria bacterium]